jgi:hypothetical protein
MITAKGLFLSCQLCLFFRTVKILIASCYRQAIELYYYKANHEISTKYWLETYKIGDGYSLELIKFTVQTTGSITQDKFKDLPLDNLMLNNAV